MKECEDYKLPAADVPHRDTLEEGPRRGLTDLWWNVLSGALETVTPGVCDIYIY